MTGSAPSDLAVAFRSVSRREAEVLASAHGDAAAEAAARPSLGALGTVLGTVADLMGVPAGSDRHATGEAIAAAITAVPADEWTSSRLEDLQARALACGRHLRAAQDAVDRVIGRD
jgi:hypothetical protein